MLSKGDWILVDSLQFIDNLFVSLETDGPLQIIYRQLFTAVVGKLRQYAHCSHGLHLLGNVMFGETKEPMAVETDHLYVHPGSNAYLLQALRSRHGDLSTGTESGELPPCVRLACAEQVQAAGWQSCFKDLLSDCPRYSPVVQHRTRWVGLLEQFNEARSKLMNDGNSVEAIKCRSSKLLIIALADSTLRLPCSPLGTVLLWNNAEDVVEKVCEVRGERLKMAAKNMSVFLSRLLSSRYSVQQDTYLPSYRISGQRRVAVMFADIRDFTPTTEICRNFGLLDDLTAFMKRYSNEMSTLIQKCGGRVHGLTGDGIVAIFGEYDLDSCKAAVRAIKAAKDMCRKFQALKSEFFGEPRLKRFFQEEYESMDMRLGIGITFGSVIFDYFGIPGSRSYGPLGDHVNFAQRLEAEANRFDAQLANRSDRMRAPILVSRPAWLAAGRNPGESSLFLAVKGKRYEYQCYECWPD